MTPITFLSRAGAPAHGAAQHPDHQETECEEWAGDLVLKRVGLGGQPDLILDVAFIHEFGGNHMAEHALHCSRAGPRTQDDLMYLPLPWVSKWLRTACVL